MSVMKKKWESEYFKSQPSIVSPDLELRNFAMSAECAPWPFSDQFKVDYSELFYQVIFGIMNGAGMPKASLSYTSPKKALEINKLQGEGTTGWVGISYKEPGREFGLTLDDTIFQIRCQGIRLEGLVELAGNIFSLITEAWASKELAEPLRLRERLHTMDFTFTQTFRLGKDKVQQKQVVNFDLLAQALSLNRKPKGKGEKSASDAYLALGAERFIRMDFKQHAIKTVDGHKLNVGTKVEAPFNEGNTILDITSFARSEEDFGFSADNLPSWETVMVSFYRELFLKRFLDNLLCSTSFTYL